MVIHFSAAYSEAIEKIDTMRQIVETIHSLGHVVSRDWLEPLYANAKKNKSFNVDNSYRFIVEAIDRAEVVIIEGSAGGFEVGFEVATALQKQKPTLLLIEGHKGKSSSLMFKMENPLLKTIIYKKDSLRSVLHVFIQENTVNTKDLRFNFVLDRKLYHFLRRKAHKTQKTKAEIVRELLLDEMKRED